MKKIFPQKKITIPTCEDEEANELIAYAHRIPIIAYGTMVSDFFGSLDPDPYILPIDSSCIDYEKDCMVYGIKITIDPTNHNNNDDIDISMCLFSDLQKPHDDHFIMHSLHLFKGLREAFKVVTLELKKAYRVEDKQNVPTVVLLGKNNKGVTVYHGDLSSMIPLFNYRK